MNTYQHRACGGHPVAQYLPEIGPKGCAIRSIDWLVWPDYADGWMCPLPHTRSTYLCRSCGARWGFESSCLKLVDHAFV